MFRDLAPRNYYYYLAFKFVATAVRIRCLRHFIFLPFSCFFCCTLVSCIEQNRFLVSIWCLQCVVSTTGCLLSHWFLIRMMLLVLVRIFFVRINCIMEF